MVMASCTDLPEVHQLDHGPEVYISNTPELLHHDPAASLPQVCYAQGIEPYRRKETVKSTMQKNRGGRAVCSKIRWQRIALLTAIVVVIAVIGGVLGSRFSRKSSSSNSSTPTLSLPSSSTSSGQPSPIPSIPVSNSSAGLASAGPTILRNSSIAATTCPNGDRWVFMQDVNGSIRGSQLSTQTSKWSVTTLNALGGVGSPNTPICASCIDVPAESAGNGLNPGLLITVIYLNTSNLFQQSQYSEGAWSASTEHPFPTPPTLPANLTKLAISTTLITPQAFSSASKHSETTEQNSEISSVLVYQDTTGAYVMLDLDPHDLKGSNIFSQLRFSTPQDSSSHAIGASLACVHNSQAPTIPGQFFTQCQLGYVGHTWIYNSSSIDGPAKLTNVAHSNWNTSTADVSITQLGKGNLVMIYLADQNSISVEIEGINVPMRSSGEPAPWPPAIPFSHIGATSLMGNSSIFYVYYQANDTSIAEISFDLNNGFWAARPEFFSVA